MGSSILSTIQEIIDTQMNAYGLADFRLGIVTEKNPLKIKISPEIIIEEEKGQIFLTEQVLLKQLDLTHVHRVLGDTETGFGPAGHTHHINWDDQKSLTTLITVTEGLEAGDAVLLLQVSRRQMYIVLSKVREKKSVIINKDDDWAWK